MRVGVFAVVGGDMRSAYAARLLKKKGIPVCTAGLERCGLRDAAPACTLAQALERADRLILPIPLVDEKGCLRAPFADEAMDLRAVLDGARPDALLFGGRVPVAFKEYACQKGKQLLDYGNRTDFARRNAALTAEGALQMLFQALPCAVQGARVLVVGFGKTGQSTARLLAAVGARVWVCARSAEARAHAESLGMQVVDFPQISRNWTGELDAVVNTVPAPVLGAQEICGLRQDCFVLDLASAPGGVDFAAAEARGIQATLAPSLPGKCAPETAGEAILQTVWTLLEERRETQ